MKRIALISTGGTIEKTYDALTGVLANRVAVLDVMLAQMDLRGVGVSRIALMNKADLLLHRLGDIMGDKHQPIRPIPIHHHQAELDDDLIAIRGHHGPHCFIGGAVDQGLTPTEIVPTLTDVVVERGHDSGYRTTDKVVVLPPQRSQGSLVAVDDTSAVIDDEHGTNDVFGNGTQPLFAGDQLGFHSGPGTDVTDARVDKSFNFIQDAHHLIEMLGPRRGISASHSKQVTRPREWFVELLAHLNGNPTN
jgi:hypothetical protein